MASPNAEVWNEVAFNTLAGIADADSESALNNPLIIEAILYGHVALQVLAIRRLTDTTKGVLSLSNSSRTYGAIANF